MIKSGELHVIFWSGIYGDIPHLSCQSTTSAINEIISKIELINRVVQPYFPQYANMW